MLQPFGSSVAGSLFLTPNYDLTPEMLFTPFKDLISPRHDNETVCGAANIPTDHSPNLPYYKPDKSSGIDKQVQMVAMNLTSVLDKLCENDQIESNRSIVIPPDLEIR